MSKIETTNFGNKAKLWRGKCEDILPTLRSSSYQLVLSSPPYNIGKSYESRLSLPDYVEFQEKILNESWRLLKPGGSFCWQVGNFVSKGSIVPIDALLYELFSKLEGAVLRNRIVWVFPHGLHCNNRLSGRYEVVLWYTKGDDYKFNLDPIRVPQKYPNKKSYKGPNKGKVSSNPLGKNPTDVWSIPNVKSNHPEKTNHPCQFPIELAERLILALSDQGDTVLDPFAGAGTTAVAAVINGRKSHAIEKENSFVRIAKQRIHESISGLVPRRINLPKCA